MLSLMKRMPTCWTASFQSHAEPPLSDSLESNAEYVESCPNLLCVPQEIAQLIKGLNISKASGSDGISACMLKATSDSIAPSLSNLFNLSISKGHFPEQWKVARMVPIPKSATKHSPSGYRPISLLSLLSKLLEKPYHQIITDHLAEHHPLSDAQWGFQKGKSTLTALYNYTLCCSWLVSIPWSQSRNMLCIFFDFQKAFDMVPRHRRLMENLKQLHFHSLTVTWLCSYLTKCHQSTVVNEATHIPFLSSLEFPKDLFWAHNFCLHT